MTQPSFGGVRPSLFVDLYELTMAAAYHATGHTGTGHVRGLRALAAATSATSSWRAGSSDLLEAIRDWHFDADDIEYLRSLGRFSDDFLSHLGELEFTGDIRAVPEGEVVFAGEPIVEITAPIIEAQLLETLVLNVDRHRDDAGVQGGPGRDRVRWTHLRRLLCPSRSRRRRGRSARRGPPRSPVRRPRLLSRPVAVSVPR